MKKLLILFCVLLVMTALALREWRLMPDGNVHLYVFDVDQGDGMLLVSPGGKQIVIDGGPNTSLLEHLGTAMPFMDRTIELLILSHPDADHITALPDILRRYTVERVLLSGIEHHTGRSDAFIELLQAHDTPIITPDPQKDIDMGDGLILDIVWPQSDVFGTEPKSKNNPSMVVRALFGSSSILFTGDIEEEAEKDILATGADIASTILKVPHHGSRSSSSTGFLLAVHPELALISSGQDNRFGHPHQDVLERYKALGIPVRNTQLEGTIHLVLPGKSY